MAVLGDNPVAASGDAPNPLAMQASAAGRWVAGATALLAACVLLFVSYGIWSGRAEDVARGKHDALTLARIIAAHAAQGIQAIDLNLATTERIFKEMPTGLPATPEQIDWLLRGRLRLNPNVRVLLTVDRNGIETHSTNVSQNRALLGSSHAEREYFRWHRDHAVDAVHIGPPIRSRTLGTYFVPVSRRLTGPDGQFNGVFVAALEPKFFQEFYTSVDLGAQGSIAIFLRDGTMLARGPHIESLVGKSFAQIPLFSNYLKSAGQGSYRQVSVADGVNRIFGYAAVAGTDLVVSAGFGEDDLLAGWRHQSATDATAAAIFVLLLLCLTWGLLKELRRRDALTDTLLREEARYRRLLSTANEGIWKIDAQRRTVLINAKVCDLLGYGKEEIMGRDPFEFVVDEDQPLKDRISRARQQNHVALQYDLRYRKKDGSLLWTITSVTSIFDETGAYIGALGMLTDITERALAEQKLLRNFKHVEALRALDQAILGARSREEIAALGLTLLRELFSYWGGAVMAFDFAKNEVEVLSVNRREDSAYDPGNRFSLETYGLRDIEVLRTGAELFVPKADGLPGLSPLLARLYTQGMRSYVRIPLLAEGELIGALNLPSDREGAYTDEQVGIARTVADQMAIGLRQATLREQVRQQAADLERRVIERTAQLEAVNKELESFSYSVSHDLRSPVRHIAGFAGMLEETAALDAEAKELLQKIQQAAGRMNVLIDDLLQLSKTTSQALNLVPLDMGRLVHEVIEELRPAQGARAIDWVVAPLPPAHGDLSLMRVVLQNLIGNAIKYSAKRADARIEIGIQAGPAGETVYFVRDNGAGFDMRYAGRLFNAFSRLHPAREFEGTGVGLATVQRIINRHGGRIWADSALDLGATFYFVLPPGHD